MKAPQMPRALRRWPVVLVILVVVAFGTLALSTAVGTSTAVRVCEGPELENCRSTEIKNSNEVVGYAGAILLVAVSASAWLVRRQAT